MEGLEINDIITEIMPLLMDLHINSFILGVLTTRSTTF